MGWSRPYRNGRGKKEVAIRRSLLQYGVVKIIPYQSGQEGGRDSEIAPTVWGGQDYTVPVGAIRRSRFGDRSYSMGWSRPYRTSRGKKEVAIRRSLLQCGVVKTIPYQSGQEGGRDSEIAPTGGIPYQGAIVPVYPQGLG